MSSETAEPNFCALKELFKLGYNPPKAISLQPSNAIKIEEETPPPKKNQPDSNIRHISIFIKSPDLLIHFFQLPASLEPLATSERPFSTPVPTFARPSPKGRPTPPVRPLTVSPRPRVAPPV